MIQATQFSTMGGPVGDPWIGLIHSTALLYSISAWALAVNLLLGESTEPH